MSDWRSSSWERGGWYKSGPKEPPPKHGIKMKKAGTTWWGQRWIEALQHVLRGDENRLTRGRTYARAGRTHDLIVRNGKVTAKVTGSRPTPYEIAIELTQLDEAHWSAAIAGMVGKAQFSAELLAGQMPREIDEVFRAAGTSLFPQERAHLSTSCSCPDWGDPCKHVAAAHYILGEALDRDPFLLFELRGKSKDEVLDALRRARGRGDVSNRRLANGASAQAAQDPIPKVVLRRLNALDYDSPREPLPTLHFAFDPHVTHGAVVRQLGTPAAWDAGETPADVLTPMLQAAAETARRIALGESPVLRDSAPVRGIASPRPKSPRRSAAKPSARVRIAKRAAAVDPADALVQRIGETFASIGGGDHEQSSGRRRKRRG